MFRLDRLCGFLLCVVMVLGMGMFASAQEPVSVPLLTTAPAVDGVFDTVYSEGAQLVDFWDFSKSVAVAVPAPKKVHAWLGHQDRTLYIFCEAEEPEPQKILRAVTQRDGPVWGDDCMELFIDPAGERKNYFQMILSSNGVTADLFNGEPSWSPNYQAAGKVWNSSWSAEWGIPFEALGIAAVDDINAEKIWTFNLCREDQVSDHLISWVPVNSAVARVFATPESFAEMRIVPTSEAKTYTLRGQPLRPQALKQSRNLWQTDDPLYAELLTKTRRSLQNDTGMFWIHPLVVSEVRPTAVQYGMEYSLPATAEVFKKVAFHPIQNGKMVEDAFSEKPGPDSFQQAKSLYIANFLYAKGEGMSAIAEGGRTILFAPKNREVFFREAEEILTQYHKNIWGIFTGDEITTLQSEMLVDSLPKLAEKHPYLKDIDQDIKNKYGLGRYGIPDSPEDPEPYKWLAMNSWIDDQTCRLSEDLRVLIDRVAPKIKLVSDDPIAGFHPYDFARRGKVCDVITHQTYPARNPLRQEFGFIAKLTSDLSGKPTWPCVHAENYGASYSPDEAAEVYSQVFRCGAEGVHFYPDDVQGTRRNILDTHYCALGAPDRWATMLSVFKRIQHLPKLKLPQETGTAIFIEPSTFMTFNLGEGGKHLEYETCFSFLGPHARSWFRFIHGGQIERKEVEFTDFKIIYLPMGKFFDPDQAQALIDFCKQGGTVVCGDPEVFKCSTKVANQPVPALADLGWDCQASTEIQKGMTFEQGSKIDLSPGVQLWMSHVKGDWKTVARFGGGQSAILSKSLGKGRWMQFTFQPFEQGLLSSETLREFFKSLQKANGQETDLDIWRFKFPTATSPAPPKEQCLTGNGVCWTLNVPKQVGGDGLAGTIRWSRPPEGVTASSLPFSESKLFDRRKAVGAANDRNLEVSLKNWAYTWTSPESLELTIDLPDSQPLSRLNLWYSGTLPTTRLYLLSDSGKWEKAGKISKRDAGSDVLLATQSLGGKKAKSVRLEITAPKGPMRLCELELWGE